MRFTHLESNRREDFFRNKQEWVATSEIKQRVRHGRALTSVLRFETLDGVLEGRPFGNAMIKVSEEEL